MKTIAITGISGFVGTNLKNAFTSLGYKVIGISRDNIKNKTTLISIMEQSSIVINLAGANIINRWTNIYKQTLYSSRIDTTKALVNAMAQANNKPHTFISTSAVGIYKDDKKYDEDTYDLGNDFLANLCKDWEIEAFRAQSLNIRTVVFRFGIVLGNGGALEKMLTPFKLGLGGTIGDGKQDFPFIHIEDLVSAYNFIIENKNLNGVFNLVAPNITTNYELTKTLGRALNKPTILPVPTFILKLIFGEGSKVLTNGQNVKPKRLLEYGFKFGYETIDKAIDNILG